MSQRDMKYAFIQNVQNARNILETVGLHEMLTLLYITPCKNINRGSLCTMPTIGSLQI